MATLRVLTWNLYHGRSIPPAGRDLLDSFASLLASWEWDAALLQEVPPWWPAALARAADADHRLVRTSRNFGLAARRAVAQRWPDLAKSNGGGSNAILARVPIVSHRCVRLRWWPERRVAQLARLETGLCLANYHASTRPKLARAELARLWSDALDWAGDAPLVLGGDLNLRSTEAAGGAIHAAARDVDHLFARGLERAGEPRRLDRDVELSGRRVQLSDHIPLRASFRGPP